MKNKKYCLVCQQFVQDNRRNYCNIHLKNKTNYRSVQVMPNSFAPYIFDYNEPTVDDVCYNLDTQGSKWDKYPIHFIVKGGYCMDFKYHKVILAPEGLAFLIGKSVRTAMQYIRDNHLELSKEYVNI